MTDHPSIVAAAKEQLRRRDMETKPPGRVEEFEAAARKVHETRKGAMFATTAFNEALDALAALLPEAAYDDPDGGMDGPDGY